MKTSKASDALSDRQRSMCRVIPDHRNVACCRRRQPDVVPHVAHTSPGESAILYLMPLEGTSAKSENIYHGEDFRLCMTTLQSRNFSARPSHGKSGIVSLIRGLHRLETVSRTMITVMWKSAARPSPHSLTASIICSVARSDAISLTSIRCVEKRLW